MRHLSLRTCLTLGFLAIAGTAFAAAPANKIASITVGGDRYVAGEDITIQEASRKDLSVAGGKITLNAPVNSALHVAGGSVVISAPVKGSARIVGGSVDILENIEGNLVVGGGNVHIGKNVVIGGSLLVFGGDLTVDGTVNGDLVARGEHLKLSGTVRGEADIALETVTFNGKVIGSSKVTAQNFDVEPPASMEKDLRYWQPLGERNFGTVVKGKSTFDEALSAGNGHSFAAAGLIAGAFYSITVYSVLSMALIIGLLLFCTKSFFKDASKYAANEAGKSALIGIAYFVLTPLVAFLLFLTVIGIPVAITILAVYAISLYYATMVTSVIAARYIEMQKKGKWTNTRIFFLSLGIAILLKLLSFIPVLGWIVVLGTVLIGFGASLRTKYDKFVKVM